MVFSVPQTPGAQAFVIQERKVERAKRPVLEVPKPTYLQQAYRYPLPWRGGPFRLTQGPNGSFSHTDAKSRYAMDIAMPEGTPIIAARSGTVVKTENEQSAGGGDASGNFVRCNMLTVPRRVLHLKQGSSASGSGACSRGSPLALSGIPATAAGRICILWCSAPQRRGWCRSRMSSQPVGTLPNLRWAIESLSSSSTLANTILALSLFL